MTDIPQLELEDATITVRAHPGDDDTTPATVEVAMVVRGDLDNNSLTTSRLLTMGLFAYLTHLRLSGMSRRQLKRLIRLVEYTLQEAT